jgi:hypothetical protein
MSKPKTTFKTYEEAAAYQLAEWLAGRPWHNPFTPDGVYGEDPTSGECCPDFSCCRPHLLRDEASRQEYVKAMTSGDGIKVVRFMEDTINTLIGDMANDDTPENL